MRTASCKHSPGPTTRLAACLAICVCECLSVCICSYVYIYMVPPQRSMHFTCFQLFPLTSISPWPFFHSRSSAHDGTNPSFRSRVSHHLLITAQTDHIETQCGPIFQYGLAEAHIEILNHIEFQYGGSKIQDCTGLLGKNLGSWILDLLYWNIEPYWLSIWRIQDPRLHGTLGEESWIMDLGWPILKYWTILSFNMADPRSKIARDSWGRILDHGSWICYIEIQYGLNISIWPSLNPRFLPGVPCNLRSWILDPPYWNSMCFNMSMWSCALLGFVVSTALVTVCMCISAASKKQTN